MSLAPRNHPLATVLRPSSDERGKMSSERACCPRSVRPSCYGRYVVSKRLQDERFEFQYPQLSDALYDLLDRRVGQF
ncbi:MAG: DUF1731 domain-containing protein [Isosphaerales bacterium]